MNEKNVEIEYAIVVSYTYSNEWLSKTPKDRRSFEEAHVFPIFKKYGGQIKRRAYDADAFQANASDFMILETKNLDSYYYMIEEMRDSQFLSKGYAKINNFMIGINNEYKLLSAPSD